MTLRGFGIPSATAPSIIADPAPAELQGGVPDLSFSLGSDGDSTGDVVPQGRTDVEFLYVADQDACAPIVPLMATYLACIVSDAPAAPQGAR